MQDRKYYEEQFSQYPDVVTKTQLMSMLGGICEKTAQGLLQSNKIEHFRINGRYYIPKVCIIDFMMQDDYERFKERIEYAHCKMIRDKVERGRQKILLLCKEPQTRKNLMFMLDVKSPKTFFRVYLNPLLEAGEIQLLYPDQPSISIQRYVRKKK